MIMEIIGWIGGTLLAFCGVPQLIKTYKSKCAMDISWWFLGMWGVGEVLTLAYIIDNNLLSGIYQYPLLANYFFNTIIISVIVYIKWKSEIGRVAESGLMHLPRK